MNHDPKFVALFDLATEASALLQSITAHLWDDVGLEKYQRPEQQALFQLVGILSTLAWETSVATTQLSLNTLPRAMHILSRSTFEYSVRLRWFHKNPSDALRQMQSLPKAVQEELKNATHSFSAETRDKLAESYKSWQAEHPELDDKSPREQFTAKAREVLGDDFDAEWFTYYSYPSIIAHGKPLAITDTMQIDHEARIMTVVPNSRHLDVHSELGKAASLVAELVDFITATYELDPRPFNALNEKLGRVLKDQGYAVKTRKRIAIAKPAK
ncbi:MAG TPA: hypothetical protein VGD01_16365 [Candidatus Elarobacter sp.]